MIKTVFFISILIVRAFLFAEILPDWVIEIPEKEGINIAVGFADICKDATIAERNAFITGCYLLACQDEVKVENLYYENLGIDNTVFYNIIKPDSLKQKYYENNAKIISSYSDELYFFVLVATDEIDYNNKLIEYHASEIPVNIKSGENIFWGYGTSKRRKAEGYLCAVWQAYFSLSSQVCSLLETSSTVYNSGNSMFEVESSSDLVLHKSKISGYYIDKKNNIMTAFIKMDKEE